MDVFLYFCLFIFLSGISSMIFCVLVYLSVRMFPLFVNFFAPMEIYNKNCTWYKLNSAVRDITYLGYDQ